MHIRLLSNSPGIRLHGKPGKGRIAKTGSSGQPTWARRRASSLAPQERAGLPCQPNITVQIQQCEDQCDAAAHLRAAARLLIQRRPLLAQLLSLAGGVRPAGGGATVKSWRGW